jgi:CHAT domain-containing protein
MPNPVVLDGGSTAGDQPTLANVLRFLPTHQLAHFACHGVNDAADPSLSRLLLQDHQTSALTVAAITGLHLDRVRLAYLSACETALTAHLPLIDEVIHLASAFQLAGYPHVIGTLWSIDDAVAASIATTFYDTLIDPTDAATTLHQALLPIRARFPGVPSLWAAHIHSGA